MKPMHEDLQNELYLRTRKLDAEHNDISSVLLRVKNHLSLVDAKTAISNEAQLQFMRDYAFLRDIHLSRSHVTELSKLGITTLQLRDCTQIVERFEGRKVEGHLGAGLFHANKSQRFANQELMNLFNMLATDNQQKTPSPRKS